MQYDSGIYWFRDYWSNRLKLNRNIMAEDFRLDAQKDFLSGELKVDHILMDKCNVQWTGGQFIDFVDPFRLSHKYEPYRISLPFNKSHLRDELPDRNYHIDAEEIKNVTAEPIVQSKGELKLWLQILYRVIIPSILLMLIEWYILGYFTTWIPELSRFSSVIMATTLAAFIYSSLIVFIRIGISETTKKVIGAKATIYLYQGKQAEKFHYRYPKDKPDWLESKPYWVFRYLFTWSFELTPSNSLPFIRAVKDIERLDIWSDAKTGKIEWIVSDYHWRELWYRAEPTLTSIQVWLRSNFHTPKPLNISINAKETLLDLYRKGHPLSKKWIDNIEKYQSSHSKYFSTKYGKNRNGLINNMFLSELGGLWWEKWRYQSGADNNIYKNSDFPATGDQPTPPISTPIPKPTISPPAAPTQTPALTPIASPIDVPPTSKPIVPSPNTLTITKPVIGAHPSPPAPTKHSGTSFYLGIAIVAIATASVIGLSIFKKTKNTDNDGSAKRNHLDNLNLTVNSQKENQRIAPNAGTGNEATTTSTMTAKID